MNRRNALAVAAAMGGGLSLPRALRAQTPAVQRLGIVSLLGNSVRVVAREIDEVMFKDVAMDETVLDAADQAVLARWPQSQLRHFVAPEQVNIDDQLKIGMVASRSGELPEWMDRAAQQAELSHLLLVNCHAGAMEFRTGLSQVVGNDRVTGVGFFVSASGRTKNTKTDAVSSGYLAPFVQLRMTLLEAASRRVLNSRTVGEGYIVGPPVAEAPDPWRFLTREQKAQALRQLLKRNVARGVEQLLA